MAALVSGGDNEWVQGPPRGWKPQPVEPDPPASVAERGRALVLEVLASVGITKTGDGRWTVDDRHDAQNRPEDSAETTPAPITPPTTPEAVYGPPVESDEGETR